MLCRFASLCVSVPRVRSRYRVRSRIVSNRDSKPASNKGVSTNAQSPRHVPQSESSVIEVAHVWQCQRVQLCQCEANLSPQWTAIRQSVRASCVEQRAGSLRMLDVLHEHVRSVRQCCIWHSAVADMRRNRRLNGRRQLEKVGFKLIAPRRNLDDDVLRHQHEGSIPRAGGEWQHCFVFSRSCMSILRDKCFGMSAK